MPDANINKAKIQINMTTIKTISEKMHAEKHVQSTVPGPQFTVNSQSLRPPRNWDCGLWTSDYSTEN